MKLNKLNYEDIKIGDIFDFERTITEDDVKKFAELTGDFSSLHMDGEYADKTEFRGRIAHGMLLGSLFSTLVGMMIPGERALYLSQDLKFKNPFRFPGKIFIRGKVDFKHDVNKVIEIKTEIRDEKNIMIVEGVARVRVRE